MYRSAFISQPNGYTISLSSQSDYGPDGSEGTITPKRLSVFTGTSPDLGTYVDGNAVEDSVSGNTGVDLDINALNHGYPRAFFMPGGIYKGKPISHQSTINSLKGQLLHFKRRVRVFEGENEALKESIVSLALENERLEDELSTLRVSLFQEMGQAQSRRLLVESAQGEIAALNKKLDDAKNFIFAMTDIKLDTPVLHLATVAILNDGTDVEEALVDAIKDAAKNKASAWSRILPAITGPRTPDNYISALNLTLSARQELREKVKVTKFWKAVAKSDPTQADTVTPSSSELDDIDELAQPAVPRATLVDDLLDRLTNETPSPIQATSVVARPLPDSKEVEYTVSVDTPSLVASDEGTPVAETRKLVTLPPPTKTKTTLTPSKDVTSDGAESKKLMTKPARRPFQEIDQNIESKIPRRSPQKSRSPFPTNVSTRALSKRRGLIMNEKMQSFSAAAKRISDSHKDALEAINPITKPEQEESSEVSSSTSSKSLSIEVEVAVDTFNSRAFKNISYSSGTLPRSCGNPRDLFPGAVANNSLLASQALLSLERICAAFSSDSLGSLEMTGDEYSDYEGPDCGSVSMEDIADNIIRSTGELKAKTSVATVVRVLPAYSLQAINVIAQEGTFVDEGTTPVASEPAVLRKSVKWALPLSDNRTSASFSFSSSGSSTSSSDQNTPSALPESGERSSPKPSRHSAATTAITHLTRSARVLRPKVTLRPSTAVPIPSKGLTPQGIRSVAALTLNTSAVALTTPTHKITTPPNVPPRSAFRPRDASVTKKNGAASAGTNSSIKINQNLENTGVSNSIVKVSAATPPEERIILTSLPQKNPKPNVRVYDYTKPTLPLRIVKKSALKAVAKTEAEAATEPASIESSTLAPAPALSTPENPSPLVSRRISMVNKSPKSPVTPPRSKNSIVSLAKRLSADLASTTPSAQVKKSTPIVPPVRTSSIRVPRVLPLSPRKMQTILTARARSDLDPFETPCSSVATPVNSSPRSSVPSIDPVPMCIEAGNVASPLTKLRLSLMPRASLARSLGLGSGSASQATGNRGRGDSISIIDSPSPMTCSKVSNIGEQRDSKMGSQPKRNLLRSLSTRFIV